MPKYTKYLQFNRKTKEAIIERDRECIFCRANYHMASDASYGPGDIMHYIPKSALGLGIEENGALGCRYHHNLMDNGNKGLREEMLGMMREHLKSHYPGWNEEMLRYRKYQF